MSSLILTLLISIVFSALFSGLEIAYVSSNKLQLELKKKSGGFISSMLKFTTGNPSVFIGAMLIGNNIALVVYGIASAKLLEPFLHQITHNSFAVFMMQIISSTALILVTAEFLPKIIFKNNANKLLEFLAPFYAVLYFILLIPAKIMTQLSNVFLTLLGGDTTNEEHSTTFGIVDLDHYIKEKTTGSKEEELENEVQILQNAIDFSSIKARECMIPRTEIIAIDVKEDIKSLTKLFRETGLSKILVYRDNIDNIIGYVHHFELFKQPKSIQNVLLPIFIVPESMSAKDVLSNFIEKQKSVALVVGELGGTSGMLTLEDVVEELVGEIEDEHDLEVLKEQRVNDYKYLFSARLEVDYLNKEYGLELPEFEGIETLGGTITQITENIPSESEIVRYEAFKFEILEVKNNRIELIKLEKLGVED